MKNFDSEINGVLDYTRLCRVGFGVWALPRGLRLHRVGRGFAARGFAATSCATPWDVRTMINIRTRLYVAKPRVALPRHDAGEAAALPRPCATPWDVRTTINIRILCIG